MKKRIALGIMLVAAQATILFGSLSASTHAYEPSASDLQTDSQIKELIDNFVATHDYTYADIAEILTQYLTYNTVTPRTDYFFSSLVEYCQSKVVGTAEATDYSKRCAEQGG